MVLQPVALSSGLLINQTLTKTTMEQKNKEQEALPVHLFKGERVVIVEKEEAVEAGVENPL